MKMKLQQVRNLATAFSMLDGSAKVINNEKVLEPYVFSAKARWNIVKNLRILNVFVTDFNNARDALIKQISNGNNEIDSKNQEQMAEYLNGLSEINLQEVEVNGILPIKLEELNLDKNQIPSSILAELGDLINE